MKAWLFASKDHAPGDGGTRSIRPPSLPVLVRVLHSSINYKDALALTRAAPIARHFPMVPGIDLVGEVIEDKTGTFDPGFVVATGHGLSESTWGAYSEEARLKAEWLTLLPDGLTAEQAAGIGTAGVTAAMAIDALERHGTAPERGPVVVTGPTGGVGSFAVPLLAQSGYAVVAVTGRTGEASYLRANGASEIIDRAELEGEPRPLSKERWSAGIDVAGGKVLADLLTAIRYGGAVAACGLASSLNLPTSVAPFILRSVSLLRMISVMAPATSRSAAWARIARGATPHRLRSDHLTSQILRSCGTLRQNSWASSCGGESSELVSSMGRTVILDCNTGRTGGLVLRRNLRSRCAGNHRHSGMVGRSGPDQTSLRSLRQGRLYRHRAGPLRRKSYSIP